MVASQFSVTCGRVSVRVLEATVLNLLPFVFLAVPQNRLDLFKVRQGLYQISQLQLGDQELATARNA
jgi:hypothetical protein